jgi:hypothetical protein
MPCHPERSHRNAVAQSKDFGCFVRWLALAAALPAFIPSPMLAQEAGPRTDALLARAEQGDRSALHDAESLAWQWIKLVAEKGNLDPVSARAMARTMLAVEGVPQADHLASLDERPFRAAALHALEMALAQDSADAWSVTQLEHLAPYPFIWRDPDQELVVLRVLSARHSGLSSELLLTRIRLELERGSPDSATAWIARLPAAATSPAARGHLAAEVAFASRKDADGAAAYYEGATAIRDSADAAWYTRDLAWIAQPDEITEWQALAPAAREAWLEKFWNRRDIDDGRLPGTRLPEQFRRWRIALRDFRWDHDNSTALGLNLGDWEGSEHNVGVGGAGDVDFPEDPGVSQLVYWNRMRPLTQMLDDRGGVVLRHGDPTKVVNLAGVDAISEQTMEWDTPSGPLIVSFSRNGRKLPDGVFTLWRFGMLARNYPVGDLTANCQVDPRLCPLAGQVLIDGQHGGPSLTTLATSATILRDYTRMRTEAEHTDGNPEAFSNDLKATVQAYGIPDLGTLVVFAVPVKGLMPNEKARAAATAYSARLRVVAGDSARGEFAGVLDTVRNWKLAAPPGDSTQLTGFVLVPTPPGTWAVAVVLSDLWRIAGTGQRIGSVPVVAFDGKTLRLGDPILGSPASGLTWAHDGDQILLNPRNAWRPDEPAILSYQVDGLVIGRAYETQIEVWEADGNPKTFRISVAFTTAAATTRMSLQREISLRQLAAGNYRIVLRVRDTVTGTEVTRDRKLAVRK